MDNIANMLTTIRNGLAVKKETVSIPYTKIKADILNVLEKEKFIKKLEIKGKKNKKIIEVTLVYDNDGSPTIHHIQKISKPSRRIYAPVKKIYPVQYGKGLWIVSTPRGILSDKEARKEKVGGEVICEIW
ncbi:30S ribosomal protein S8 [Patescibacteria group bacterium]|nr:30S ribosomal protein S8 [Patescibacteria group bacterium]